MSSSMVMVNGKPFKVDKTGDQALVNGQLMQADVVSVGPDRWHILHNGKSYNVELAEGKEGKEMIVNGTPYPFEVQDPMAELLRKLGMSTNGASKVAEVKAPMPGLVLRIVATPGQVVKKGDQLLVLEAMKMENVIKSPVDATVRSIEVEQGKAVEKGQVLIKFI